MTKLTVNYITKAGRAMILTSVYAEGSLTEAKLLVPFPAQEGAKVEVDLTSASVDANGFIRGAKFPFDKDNLPDGVVVIGGDDDAAVNPDELFD